MATSSGQRGGWMSRIPPPITTLGDLQARGVSTAHPLVYHAALARRRGAHMSSVRKEEAKRASSSDTYRMKGRTFSISARLAASQPMVRSPLVQGNKFQMSGTQLIITAGIFAFLFMTLMLCATGLLLHYLT